MLGVGVCPPRPPPHPTKPSTSWRLYSAVNIFPLLSSPQICQSHFSASQLSFPTFNLSLDRKGVCLFAQNKHRNGGGGEKDTTVLEGEGFEEEEEEFDVEDDDYEDDDVDGGEDGDDLDVIVSVDELDDWLQRKPLGFGEGKVYDTSIEEKLLQEIEQSRKAQLANINKLERLSSEPEKQLSKEPEVVSSGACVRITNLPKKKNIQRDLKTAFKGIPGIVNITPVVSGNKKTKDPICKGLAFVDFKSLEDAKRFIEVFSRQNITFGKIDKQIKCELLNSMYNNTSQKKPSDRNVEGENHAESDDNNAYWLLDEEGDLDESWDSDSGDEDVREGFESLNVSEQDVTDQTEQQMKRLAASSPSTRKDIPQAAMKVKSVGRRKNRSSVPKIPGAAKRLKQREKAMLADVFSRYASKIASASKES